MKQSIPTPIAIGLLAAALIVALGFGWSKLNDNGERPNPNVGKPDLAMQKKVNVRVRGQETEQEYMDILKANRPDLSDAEIQAKADNWWKIKTGGK